MKKIKDIKDSSSWLVEDVMQWEHDNKYIAWDTLLHCA